MLKILRILLIILNIFLLCLAQDSEASKKSHSESFDLKKPLKLCWTYENTKIIDDGFASDNDNVFISQTDGKLLSIDKITNDIKWQIDLGGTIIRKPSVFEKSLIILSVGRAQNEEIELKGTNLIVRSIDKNNGLVNWQSSIIKKKENVSISNPYQDKEDSFFTFGITSEGKIILVSNNDIFLLNSKTGEIAKQKNIREKITAKPLIAQNRIIYGIENRRIFILSAANLEDIVNIKVSSTPNVFYYSQNTLVWGDTAGNLFELRKYSLQANEFSKKGKLFRTGGKINSIDAFGDFYLISSMDNFVYLISKQNGEIKWKKRFANRFVHQPLIFTNYAFLQTVGDSTAWIIEMASGNLANKVDLPEQSFFNGEAQLILPYILLQTNRGILFFGSENNCLKRVNE